MLFKSWLTPEQIDLEHRAIFPSDNSNLTKRQWITFFNNEAKSVLEKLLAESKPNKRIFKIHKDALTKAFRLASEASGVKITPQVLRKWFSCELAKLGMPDRYVDAFCGRVPRSVLARHYTEYSPERLREIYDRAGLRVLS
jgi:integrase